MEPLDSTSQNLCLQASPPRIPDGGKRHRRNGDRGVIRQHWYALYRQIRFAARFGGAVIIDEKGRGR
jgi:hypothetical protein